MSRKARIVILCEDNQHEAFARRFLARAGRKPRHIRVEKAQRGGGAGERFVTERFPKEVAALGHTSVSGVLIVLIDGDAVGVHARIDALRTECEEQGVGLSARADRVFTFVPTRSIETWLAYLSGRPVDEAEQYPRLERERDCQEQVATLARMCAQDGLRQPAPPSLAAACDEYGRLAVAWRRIDH